MSDVEEALVVPLEDPQAEPKPKGLFSRSSLVYLGIGLIVLLVVLAVRDITRKPPAQVAAKGAAGSASAPVAAPPPNPEDIRRIAEQQLRAQQEAEKQAREAEQAASAPAQSGDGRDASRTASAASGSYPQPPAPPADVAVATRAADGRPVPVVVRGRASGGGGGAPIDFARTEADAKMYTSTIVSLESDGGSKAGAPSPVDALTSNIDSTLARLKANMPADAGQADSSAIGDQIAKLTSAMHAGDAPQVAGGGHRTDADVQWLKEQSAPKGDSELVTAHRIAAPYVLLEGSRIPVTQLQGLNSDMPGPLKACVRYPVRDSLTQTKVLIPIGTCFLGKYSSEIRPGQSRVLFAFHRMVLPDGRWVDLTGAEGVDNIGRAGIEGDVDNHFLKMFGESFAIAWLASKTPNTGASTSTVGGTGSVQTSSVAGQVLEQIATQILQRDSAIPPTITLDPAMPFYIVITKDIALDPWESQ